MTYWKKGDHNAQCDICGFHFKASELIKMWNGLYACNADYETRHPQDFVRSKPETIKPAWVRPDPDSMYTTTTLAAGGSASPSASLTSNLLFYDSSGGAGTRTVNLPTANNASFVNCETMYIINNLSSTYDLTIASTSVIVGSTTVTAGNMGRYRNSINNNMWIRE